MPDPVTINTIRSFEDLTALSHHFPQEVVTGLRERFPDHSDGIVRLRNTVAMFLFLDAFVDSYEIGRDSHGVARRTTITLSTGQKVLGTDLHDAVTKAMRWHPEWAELVAATHNFTIHLL